MNAIAHGPDPLTSLRRLLGDAVVTPDEPGYDEARGVWNLAFEHRPSLVAYPSTAADVAAVVRYAVEAGTGLAVHATGHGVAREARGAVLLNLSRMTDVRLDAPARRAWVGGGAKWQAVLDAAVPHGLAPLLGSTPDVGAVGYTLGGGMGWLARAYGLSSDSVHAFEVVTADGQVRRVTRTENAELFWGLRGGGAGSLAVVTGMEISLYPVAEVYGGNLLYPVEMAAEVMARWRGWIAGVPDALTSAVTLMNYPPFDDVPEPLRGRSFALVRGAYAGPAQEGERLLAAWRRWRTPAFDQFGVLPFGDIAAISQDPVDPLPAEVTGAWLADLRDEAIDTLAGATFPAEGPPLLVFSEVRHAGGAIARVPAEDSAYGHRSQTLSLEMVGVAPDHQAGAAVRAHTDAVKAALGESLTGAVYLNFVEGRTRRESALAGLGAASLERLRALKAEVDPGDLFDHGLDLTGSAT